MTLLPTVPRLRERPASFASRSSARLTPKLSLAPSVPAIDWNTKSTGRFRSISSIVVVTCASTHDCVGISNLSRMSSIRRNRSPAACGESVAGLMPMTASPQPSSRPSSVAAAIPRASSVG
ncbi:Uncharacterised protein [Mycobacteroides abscessus subsp. abscessus]|nr:Uncharacterised protein [Mycobacteroides abscessus subsp. abscessus]